MRAHIGDWIVVESVHVGEHRRRGQITGVEHPDGTPPYVVRWLEDGHSSLFFPGPEAHLERVTPHMSGA